MLPSTSVVVPTYGTRAGAAELPEDAVYDHPTPLGEPGTIGALLDSLENLDTSSFYLLVIAAVTGDDVAAAAEENVRRMLAERPEIVSLVFGRSQLPWLHEWCAGRGVAEAAAFLDLQNYPKIRNLQLALPQALGSRAIVALDDDEIVTDPEFLHKAIEPLGSAGGGQRVAGLSGHYLQENGSSMLNLDVGKAQSPNMFDRKAAIMTAATEMLEEEPGNLVETPFCFGGNMEFTPELAAAVGFDPSITRGEDIDYLINARMEGKTFFLRKDLRILHCPPRGGSYKDVSLSKLEQDIVRFTYERAKLQASQQSSELQPVTVEELMPYPGEFFSDHLETDAIGALEGGSCR